MKKTEDSFKYVQNIVKKDPLLKSAEVGFNPGLNRKFKRFIYVSSLVGMGLIFNSCVAGYVETEPIYHEGIRPMRPSNAHIWIDGDWIYNRQSRSYSRQEGHWNMPVQGKVYVTGSWRATAKGKRWTPGRWQRQK